MSIDNHFKDENCRKCNVKMLRRSLIKNFLTHLPRVIIRSWFADFTKCLENLAFLRSINENKEHAKNILQVLNT
jgi:hypothetical protein